MIFDIPERSVCVSENTRRHRGNVLQSNTEVVEVDEDSAGDEGVVVAMAAEGFWSDVGGEEQWRSAHHIGADDREGGVDVFDRAGGDVPQSGAPCPRCALARSRACRS